MTTDTAPDTTSRGRTAAAQRQAVRPRRKKGEGQWALGYREPLNPNEQSKKDDHPLNVRARIENIYQYRIIGISHTLYNSHADSDSRPPRRIDNHH